MEYELFSDGKWLTTVKASETTLSYSDTPVDYDRVFTVKTDFSEDLLSKLAEKKPGYDIVFGGGARGTTEGVDEDGIIVRMLNSEFQKLQWATEE